MELSTCCDSPKLFSDICQECKEHADFYDDEENHGFDIGDTIRNIKPYKGESDLYISGTEKYGYVVNRLKGKHCKEHDFNNTELIVWEQAHKFYEKVESNATTH